MHDDDDTVTLIPESYPELQEPSPTLWLIPIKITADQAGKVVEDDNIDGVNLFAEIAYEGLLLSLTVQGYRFVAELRPDGMGEYGHILVQVLLIPFEPLFYPFLELLTFAV